MIILHSSNRASDAVTAILFSFDPLFFGDEPFRIQLNIIHHQPRHLLHSK